MSGAAPLAPEVVRRLLDLTGRYVFEGYGLTEAAPTVTEHADERGAATRVGRPAGPRRRGAAGRLRRAPPVDADDPGEIAVRGANLFSGYWPDGRDGPDAEGWWCTADLAIELDGGDLPLVDRRPELILVSGFNVYPREVEDVLLTHPDVEEAAVFGIPHPYTGEAVKALSCLRPGAVLSVDDVLGARRPIAGALQEPDRGRVRPGAAAHGAGPGKVAKARLREMGIADPADGPAPVQRQLTGDAAPGRGSCC